MFVIKRSGKREAYSIDKVRNSLAAASDEAKQPLNESELHQLVHAFGEIVADKEEIASKHIAIILCGLLYADGYTGVLEAYRNHKAITI